MPKFLVRKNCEFSLLVEAADAEEAMDKAHKVSLDDWGQAWSDVEAEEEDTPQQRDATADCGCVYHAEEGLPCPHDLAKQEE